MMRLRSVAGYPKQRPRDRVIEHKQYVARYGEDMPGVRNWEGGRLHEGRNNYFTSRPVGSCRRVAWGRRLIQTGYTHLQ
jgi:hypothetical protein